MNSLLIGLYADTFLHPGSGQNEGAIDLPVMRERSTDHPVITGSALKGALRARLTSEQQRICPTGASSETNSNPNKSLNESDQQRLKELSNQIKQYFGQQENAGGILVGDARLLLLPVRSLTGSFKWVTCPLILKRLLRSMERSQSAANTEAQTPKLPRPQANQYCGINTDDQTLYLEERVFDSGSALDEDWIAILQHLMPTEVGDELPTRLTVLHDDDFAWFARHGLSIQARNVLDEATKTSNNLWYEETLPPDTLFYTLLLPRFQPQVLANFYKDTIADNPYLQIGGNETIGQGWVTLTPQTTPGDTREEAA